MKHHLKAGVRRGTLVGGRHGAIIDEAQKIIVLVKKCPHVNRVITCRVNHAGPGKRRIKFLPVLGGFRVSIRGSCAVQSLIIHTDNPTATQQTIEGGWDGLVGG